MAVKVVYTVYVKCDSDINFNYIHVTCISSVESVFYMFNECFKKAATKSFCLMFYSLSLSLSLLGYNKTKAGKVLKHFFVTN